MTSLAVQQEALLDALLAWPPHDAWCRLSDQASGVGSMPLRGLQAYQSNGHMLAESALRAAYPVLTCMLGDSSFAELARALWHAHPPQRGDVAEWGEALAAFIAHGVQLVEEPYLADVARAEWLLHRCALAPDSAISLATLAMLTTEDPKTLTLELAPGLASLASKWPLASLLLAHMQDSPTMDELSQQLRDHLAQDLVLWRVGYQPRLRQAQPGELLLLRALQEGMGLEPALDAATALDFSQWLPLAVQSGMVLGARRCAAQLSEPAL